MEFRESDVELPSGGDLCRGWFFTPEPRTTAVPCIVMAHGLGLDRRCGLREFALAFVRAGYAVLLFDYRCFGDSGGEPRQLVSFRKQVEDWNAAVELARGRPEVDPHRVVAWGFSLGAGHALTVAARNDSVAAVVAVAPMFDGLSSTLAAALRWSPWSFARIMARATKDLVGSWFGRPPTTVPIAAHPGELGLLTSADAYPGFRAIVPSDFDYEIAARIGLLFWSYVPGRLLGRFTRPILVLPSILDKINPPGPTIRRARRCPTATIVELDCEHMEVALQPHLGRVAHETLGFLANHLPSR